MIRAILTVQANQRDNANAALAAKGFGPDCFSVPIIPQSQGQGTPPISHYGCNWQMTDAEKKQVEQILAGVPSVVWKVLDRTDPATALPKFEDELTARGLKRYITAE